VRKIWYRLFGRKRDLSTSEALFAVWLGYRVRKTTWRAGVFIRSYNTLFIHLYVRGGQYWKCWMPYTSDFAPHARWEVVP
jgi:hypothetical protein